MSLEVKGFKRLKAKLEKIQDKQELRKIVKEHGAELNRNIVKRAVFVKGYSTGATRRSIKLVFKNGGLTSVVSPGTEYAPYLEYGTRFMKKKSFVRPALNKQAKFFKKDLKRLVE